MERLIRGVVVAGVGFVALGGAVVFWQANCRLLSEREIAGGTPCRTIAHAEALRLGLEFPKAFSTDRDPVNGVLANVIGTRKRCAQVGSHASCGVEGAGYVRVRADDALTYFVLGEGEAGLLDVKRGRARCVLAEPEVVGGRFGQRQPIP